MVAGWPAVSMHRAMNCASTSLHRWSAHWARSHADFVDVGKGQGNARLDRGTLFFNDAAGLAAEIAGGAIDQG
jgi:hypothetical protein